MRHNNMLLSPTVSLARVRGAKGEDKRTDVWGRERVGRIRAPCKVPLVRSPRARFLPFALHPGSCTLRRRSETRRRDATCDTRSVSFTHIPREMGNAARRRAFCYPFAPRANMTDAPVYTGAHRDARSKRRAIKRALRRMEFLPRSSPCPPVPPPS